MNSAVFWRQSDDIGEARVLTHQYVNDGIRRATEEEAKQLARQQTVAERKRIAERKAIRNAVEKQWRVDLKSYTGVVIPAWQAECAEINASWAATKQATGKKRSTGMKRSYTPSTEATFKAQREGYWRW